MAKEFSSRSRVLLWRVGLTALMLGVVSGFMCGLTRSPVAGVAIPGVLGIAAAAVGIGAERLSIFKLRWVYFSQFATVFAIFFAISLAGGMWLNSSQPKALDQFIASLRALGLTDREVANALAATVAESPEAIRLFDNSAVFYSANSSAPAEQVPKYTIDAATCEELRPPDAGYTAIAVLNSFKMAGQPFSKIAKYVDAFPLIGVADTNRAKLLMLAAAHYGVCRS